jgi:hypothetical protein
MTDVPTPNAAQALRDAGFMPLPRLWVKNEDMPKVYAIVNSVGLEVREIRQKARREFEAAADLVDTKEAAWAAYEKNKTK